MNLKEYAFNNELNEKMKLNVKMSLWYILIDNFRVKSSVTDKKVFFTY